MEPTDFLPLETTALDSDTWQRESSQPSTDHWSTLVPRKEGVLNWQPYQEHTERKKGNSLKKVKIFSWYKEERGLTLASVWGSEPVGEQDIQFRECLMLDFLSGDPILSLARVPSILLRCHQEEERGGSAMGTEQFPRIFPLR